MHELIASRFGRGLLAGVPGCAR